MSKKVKLLLFIANIMIGTSIIVSLYVLHPILATYILPTIINTSDTIDATTLKIPKIKAQARIIEDVNPFDKSEYQAKLKQGIAHAKGTSRPGEKGTIYLFAHSSGPPWELTRQNTIFLRLGELQSGDEIEIIKNGIIFTYIVREKKIVLPSEITYLLNTGEDQLILQTCTPIGTDLKRLLVFAELQKTS